MNCAEEFCETDYFYFVAVPQIPNGGKTDVLRCLERCNYAVPSRSIYGFRKNKNKACIASLTAFCFSNEYHLVFFRLCMLWFKFVFRLKLSNKLDFFSVFVCSE